MWRLTDTSAMPYGKYKGRPMMEQTINDTYVRVLNIEL